MVILEGGCTILCLPVAWALAWTLRCQEKWALEFISWAPHSLLSDYTIKRTTGRDAVNSKKLDVLRNVSLVMAVHHHGD